jgi:hypothetical protein
MNKQDPEYTRRAIHVESTYERLYDPAEMKREGQIIDMETLKLVQGIVLGDQEDKSLAAISVDHLKT